MCHARMIDQQTLATDMPDHIHKTDTSERIKEARHMLPRKHTKSHPIYRTSVYRSSSEAVSTSWSLRICACSTPCYISPSGVFRTQARRWTRHMRTFPCTSFHFPLNKKKRGARSQRRHLEVIEKSRRCKNAHAKVSATSTGTTRSPVRSDLFPMSMATMCGSAWLRSSSIHFFMLLKDDCLVTSNINNAPTPPR